MGDMTNYIVSGCPRSGTSLLMQIISRSGMQVATDKKREADDDNLHGYYEVENIIDKIKSDPQIVFNYTEQVLKVVHYGLQYLPKGDYKIVYMDRNIEEVLDSMEKMIGKKDNNREDTKQVFLKLNEKIKKLMQQRKDIDYVVVNFSNLIENPTEELQKVIRLFGIESAKISDMVQVIDPSCYRNRRG